MPAATHVTDPDTRRVYSRDTDGTYSRTEQSGERVTVHPDGPLAAGLDAAVSRSEQEQTPGCPGWCQLPEGHSGPAPLLSDSGREHVRRFGPHVTVEQFESAAGALGRPGVCVYSSEPMDDLSVAAAVELAESIRRAAAFLRVLTGGAHR